MAVRPDMRRRLVEFWAAEELPKRLEGQKIGCLESPVATAAHRSSWSQWKRLRHRISIPVAEHGYVQRALQMWSSEAVDYVIIGGAWDQSLDSIIRIRCGTCHGSAPLRGWSWNDTASRHRGTLGEGGRLCDRGCSRRRWDGSRTGWTRTWSKARYGCYPEIWSEGIKKG